MRTGLEKEVLTPWYTWQELNLCSRWLRNRMRNAAVVPSMGRYHSPLAGREPCVSDAPSQSEVSMVTGRKEAREEQPWLN